jgi:hypothetical protein
MGWDGIITSGDKDLIKYLVEGTMPQSLSLYLTFAVMSEKYETAYYLYRLGCGLKENEINNKERLNCFKNYIRKEKIKLLDKQINQL